MSSYNLVANAMVLAGAFILVLALSPVRQLIGQLSGGPLRRRWTVMIVLITIFLIGYLAYVAAFWGRHEVLLDLIVPTIFLLGGCFVWLTANLSLQTAVDVMRVSRLERETITDALTGVFNRRYLDNRLAEELARSRRYGFSLSVIFLDIDHFKRVNDDHGHPLGDKVLAAVAKNIASGLRDTDVAARFGGEEFVVVTPHTGLSGATDVAQRLIKAIEAHPFDLPGAPGGLRITCSAGVASLDESAADAAALLDAADKSLYRAKQQGRNRVVSAGNPVAATTG